MKTKKAEKVGQVLQELALEFGKIQDECHGQVIFMKKEMDQSMQKMDTNKKIIENLETKIFEGERQRIALRKERDHAEDKAKQVQSELEQTSLTQEVIGMLRSSQQSLEQSNDQLKMEMLTQKRQFEEKESIWVQELAYLKQKFLQHKVITNNSSNTH